ncbi:isochorismatase family protein [Pseudoruegeria sp. HB172150]|uniref:isochorismatase family protein n=1 Tax=Pseudoruegeria sp. HB172150 TaxID=2721164 RepID=UPI0015544BC6|nr:isochorismatase family protein [Pseudoruegeria sp. HB172150]
MAVWEEFLSEDDKKVLEIRKPRELNGPGSRQALLVIDMQMTAIGYDKPIWEQLDEYSGACGPHAWKSIPYQQKMIGAAREVGMPVIYSKHVFHPYMGLPRAAPGDNFSSLSHKSEIPDELVMQEGDILIEKQTPSCFAYTNLPLILKHYEIDGLLVMGNSTSGCVRATVVDGRAAGYAVSVIEECVFDRIELSHAAALFDMQFKYCDVISADEALAIIDGTAEEIAA